MFRITRKADYAVFILSFLARRAAEEGPDALVSAQELASFSALNKSLVANLLKDLNRAGFLSSVRGARGGYRLDRPANRINLLEILRTVEGPFTFVECAQGGGPEDDESADPGFAALEDGAAGKLAAGELAAEAPPLERAAAATDDECCNLTGLCTSKGPLMVLHLRIQQLLEDISLAELSGLDTSRAAEIAQELFPSRRALEARDPAEDHSPAGQSPAGHSPAGHSPAGQSPAGQSPVVER